MAPAILSSWHSYPCIILSSCVCAGHCCDRLLRCHFQVKLQRDSIFCLAHPLFLSHLFVLMEVSCPTGGSCVKELRRSLADIQWGTAVWPPSEWAWPVNLSWLSFQTSLELQPAACWQTQDRPRGRGSLLSSYSDPWTTETEIVMLIALRH